MKCALAEQADGVTVISGESRATRRYRAIFSWSTPQLGRGGGPFTGPRAESGAATAGSLEAHGCRCARRAARLGRRQRPLTRSRFGGSDRYSQCGARCDSRCRSGRLSSYRPELRAAIASPRGGPTAPLEWRSAQSRIRSARSATATGPRRRRPKCRATLRSGRPSARGAAPAIAECARTSPTPALLHPTGKRSKGTLPRSGGAGPSRPRSRRVSRRGRSSRGARAAPGPRCSRWQWGGPPGAAIRSAPGSPRKSRRCPPRSAAALR